LYGIESDLLVYVGCSCAENFNDTESFCYDTLTALRGSPVSTVRFVFVERGRKRGEEREGREEREERREGREGREERGKGSVDGAISNPYQLLRGNSSI
jgi:hypothetical protein